MSLTKKHEEFKLKLEGKIAQEEPVIRHPSIKVSRLHIPTIFNPEKNKNTTVLPKSSKLQHNYSISIENLSQKFNSNLHNDKNLSNTPVKKAVSTEVIYSVNNNNNNIDKKLKSTKSEDIEQFSVVKLKEVPVSPVAMSQVFNFRNDQNETLEASNSKTGCTIVGSVKKEDTAVVNRIKYRKKSSNSASSYNDVENVMLFDLTQKHNLSSGNQSPRIFQELAKNPNLKRPGSRAAMYAKENQEKLDEFRKNAQENKSNNEPIEIGHKEDDYVNLNEDYNGYMIMRSPTEEQKTFTNKNIRKISPEAMKTNDSDLDLYDNINLKKHALPIKQNSKKTSVDSLSNDNDNTKSTKSKETTINDPEDTLVDPAIELEHYDNSKLKKHSLPRKQNSLNVFSQVPEQNLNVEQSLMNENVKTRKPSAAPRKISRQVAVEILEPLENMDSVEEKYSQNDSDDTENSTALYDNANLKKHSPIVAPRRVEPVESDETEEQLQMKEWETMYENIEVIKSCYSESRHFPMGPINKRPMPRARNNN